MASSDSKAPVTSDEQRAREWLIEWNKKHALHPSQDDCVNSLAALLARRALERDDEWLIALLDTEDGGGWDLSKMEESAELFRKRIREKATLEARKEALEEAAAVIERSPTWDKHSKRGTLCWCELCTYVRGNVSEIRSLAAASKTVGGGQ